MFPINVSNFDYFFFEKNLMELAFLNGMKTIEAYKLFRLSNIFGPNKTDIDKAVFYLA